MVAGTHLRVTHGWSIDQYRETFEPRQHVATCSQHLSERCRDSVHAAPERTVSPRRQRTRRRPARRADVAIAGAAAAGSRSRAAPDPEP
jgi:hypothetical protein